MSKNFSGKGSPLPINCPECNEPLPLTHYFCKSCKELVCFKCGEAHVKNKHSAQRPLLTPMGCNNCGGPIDGQCSKCFAPLCQNWGCRETHENKHYDTRSDEEKKKKPLNG